MCLLDVHVCLLYIIQFFGCCCPRSLSLYYPFSLFSSSSFFLLLPSPFKPSPIYTRHCTYPFISSGLPFPYIYICIPRYIYSGLNKRKKERRKESCVLIERRREGEKGTCYIYFFFPRRCHIYLKNQSERGRAVCIYIYMYVYIHACRRRIREGQRNNKKKRRNWWV